MMVNIPRVIGASADTPADIAPGLARSVATFAALVAEATLRSGSYRLEIPLATVLSGFVKPYGQASKLPRQLATSQHNWQLVTLSSSGEEYASELIATSEWQETVFGRCGMSPNSFTPRR